MRRGTKMPATRARALSGPETLHLSDRAEELIGYGVEVGAAYRSVGVTKVPRMARLRRLRHLAPKVREMVKSGEIVNADLLYCIAGIDPPEGQILIARAYIKGSLTKRAILTAMFKEGPEGLSKQIMALAKASEES